MDPVVPFPHPNSHLLLQQSRAADDDDDGEEAPIHGDLLEAMLSHVPLIYLVHACFVSKSWHRAVFSSLSVFKRAKPWLLVHAQAVQSGSSRPVHAYDPRSNVWVQLSQPLIKHHSDLRSSNSNLLYVLSSSTLSFSLDPLRVVWQHVAGPSVWRVDPLVALVGSRIVVAGGGSEYEDEPLAVEVYDVEGREWYTCESMPTILEDSAASSLLSIAADHRRMFVVEKTSGMTYAFTPDKKVWQGPFRLRPDPRVFFFTVGFAGDYLILGGLIGHAGDVKGLKLWKVNCETMDCEGIGEMPSEFVEKLRGDNSTEFPAFSISATKDFAYIYNSWEPEELVFCEIDDGGVHGWGSVRNVAWDDGTRAVERVVFSCGRVEIGDLQRAMRLPGLQMTINKNS
ncbi:hypothetical protein Ancab_020471 [Ancistrocladus abbreviatus]